MTLGPIAFRVVAALLLSALPAQVVEAEKPAAEDPTLAAIRVVVKEANDARAAGKQGEARASVKSAFEQWRSLSRVEEREGAHSVLETLAQAASDCGELRVAHEAWQRCCEYRERTLPDDHPDLQKARHKLANSKDALGDIPGALALREKVYEVQSRTLPDDHPDLQAARNNLAVSREALGDIPGALALREKVYEVQSCTLPDDHPDLQAARNNLAVSRHALGDIPGALALREKVYEVWSRTLPDDHPNLQTARGNLANSRHALGDIPGALALREKVYEVRSRTLPDDHPDLQRARQSLAISRHALGDIPGALALREKVYEVRSRTLPDDHPDLQKARHELANSRALGDLPGALVLREKVYEVRLRTLPDDHPDLQAARTDLAISRHALGDIPGALALREKVYEVMSRTLPDDHPNLQTARNNLAVSKHALGDLPGALALREKVYEVWSRTLPDDHPNLQAARQNLANSRHALGDLPGALALFEKVYEVQSRTLPDDHPNLQAARQNLANSRHALGDLPGALALFEKVYEVQSRTLPDDHPNLQTARNNLANSREDLGDIRGALALREKVYEVMSRTLPDDHPNLQTARNNLANSREDIGDIRGALALREKVYEVMSRTLPDDHPDLQMARQNLANSMHALGDLPGELALCEKVYEVQSRTLPDDHPDLQLARRNLAWSEAALGANRSTTLASGSAAAARRRLATWILAPRAAGALAQQEAPTQDLLLTLAQGFGAIPADAALLPAALLLAQTLRGAEINTARRSRLAAATDAEQASKLTAAIQIAVAEVARHAGQLPPEALAEDAYQSWRKTQREQLARAVERKEQLQKKLITLAAKSGGVDAATITLPQLAAALPERSVATAVVAYQHWRPDPEHAGRTIEEHRLIALVLDREAVVRLVPLGPRQAIEDLVAAVRAQAGAASGRGRDPEEKTDRPADPLIAQRQLRRLVLDPILAAAPGADTIQFAVDEALELVPLDALPADDGMLVGSRVALRPLVSLFDLLQNPTTTTGPEPRLLAIGGLDYQASADSSITVLADAIAPVLDGMRNGQRESFAALANAMGEVTAIQGSFAQAFTNDHVRLLTARDATKAALIAAAPSATFLHFATHGYFAPESVRSAADRDDRRDAFVGEQPVTGLSPLALCGLALSGANLPADAQGRHRGILTAEEILALDLSHCYLVTLSACDTSLGVRRAGQGYASLRSALQGAGARYVLTSLWKVGDQATMELMVDFYRRLWVDQKEPHQALWEARMEARRKGAPFRDWAGWVLTGR